jgi:hypothetical protein
MILAPEPRLRLARSKSQFQSEELLMIIVRNCFTAKPGLASKLAAQLKEAAGSSKLGKFRVLTDMTGDFNRVILEYEAENIGAFEATMKDYATNAAFREKMKGYTDLWVTGSREILQVA